MPAIDWREGVHGRPSRRVRAQSFSPKKPATVARKVPRNPVFVVTTAANQERARAAVFGVRSPHRAGPSKARCRPGADADAIASRAREGAQARTPTGSKRCARRSPARARCSARSSAACARRGARRAPARARRAPARTGAAAGPRCCARAVRPGRAGWCFAAASGSGLFDLLRLAVGARATEQHGSAERRKQTQTHHRCFSNPHLVSLPLVFSNTEFNQNRVDSKPNG